jgi:hypothetical protein
MTIDQFPLPSAAIRPLPPPWPAAARDGDRFDADAAAANRPRQDEPPIGPSGWPRIFPGL